MHARRAASCRNPISNFARAARSRTHTLRNKQNGYHRSQSPPTFPESVADGTVATWKKKPGEAVKRDELIVDIETDKVVLEVPAPASGVLAEIVKDEGGTVTSGEVLARIDTAGKAAAAPATAPAAEAPKAAAQAAAAPAAPASTAAAGVASPAAAKILAEKGVDAANVAGTGQDGRVTKGDALNASAPAATAAPAKPPRPPPPRPRCRWTTVRNSACR